MSYVDRIVRWSEGSEWRDGSGLRCEPGDYPEVRYDLARIAREVDRDALARGPSSLWRYSDLLPIDEPERAVTLGEGWTPVLPMPRLGEALGCSRLSAKDDGRNPSGTFKDRGASVAVTRLRELGISTVVHNSSGNAGGAWAPVRGSRGSALRQSAAARRDGGKPAAEHVEWSGHGAVRRALAGIGRRGGEGRRRLWLVQRGNIERTTPSRATGGHWREWFDAACLDAFARLRSESWKLGSGRSARAVRFVDNAVESRQASSRPEEGAEQRAGVCPGLALCPSSKRG